MTQFKKDSLSSPKTRRRLGFTLIELMISIALALLLVLGINAVFKMSADTVGTGTQLGNLLRALRPTRSVFDNDISNMAPVDENPGLIITSVNQPAFKDQKDELMAESVTADYQQPYTPGGNDLDQAQSQVLDVRTADGTSAYGTSARGISPNIYLPQILNDRNHRTDTLAFGMKSPDLRRQTPNYGNNYSGNNVNKQISSANAEYQGMYNQSQSAWVVYGHLLQPDNSVNAGNMLTFDSSPSSVGGQTHFLGLGVTRDPYTQNIYVSGAPSGGGSTFQVNPNNFYASNWILGRTAILLGDPQEMDNYTNPYVGLANNAGSVNPSDPQTFLMDPNDNYSTNYVQTAPVVQQSNLRPMSWGSAANVQTTASNTPASQLQIQTSQCDVAGISMESLREKALNAQNIPSTANTGTLNFYPRWYLPLLAMGYGYGETANPLLPNTAPSSGWVWPQSTRPASFQTAWGYYPWHQFRFMGQAWPDKVGSSAALTGTTTPNMHEQLAVQTPVFLRGCSQFIVEYAGDYLQQKSDVNDTTSSPNAIFGTMSPTAPVGTIKGFGEDGEIDFDVIPDPSSTSISIGGSATYIKRIRWYGMTRSLDDGQTVEDTTAPFPTMSGFAGVPGVPPLNPNMVRPLYRYMQNYAAVPSINPAVQAMTWMPFEKVVGQKNGSQPFYTGFPDQHPKNIDSYTAAWGPMEMNLNQLPAKNASTTIQGDPAFAAMYQYLQASGVSSMFPSRSMLPWMIRVTIRLDDPTGRLPDGQTVQFIFNVPRPH